MKSIRIHPSSADVFRSVVRGHMPLQESSKAASHDRVNPYITDVNQTPIFENQLIVLLHFEQE